MPHFIIDCSENILSIHNPEELLQEVHNTAENTGLFKKGDIKVRIQSYRHSIVGNMKSDFIHVFAYIMEGRTTDQKAGLSKNIVARLKSMYPDVPVISINVMDFEKSTYSNRNLV
jgi:5-carboxymethyl-2-hydroxymuconate isomerase